MAFIFISSRYLVSTAVANIILLLLKRETGREGAIAPVTRDNLIFTFGCKPFQELRYDFLCMWFKRTAYA